MLVDTPILLHNDVERRFAHMSKSILIRCIPFVNGLFVRSERDSTPDRGREPQSARFILADEEIEP
jgi:hypothetical protein